MSAALLLKPSVLVFGNDSITSNHAPNNGAGVKLYSREMFEPYIGDTFQVRVGKQIVDLKLVALSDVKSASGITTGKVARTDCFSMRFCAVKPLPAPKTVHTLNHSKLGNVELFMTQSKDGSRYLQTAIINQLA